MLSRPLQSSSAGCGRVLQRKAVKGSFRAPLAPQHCTTVRLASTFKPNVLRNDPFIPIYAGITTLGILGVLTVYKNYKKTTEMEAEVEIVRNEIIDSLHHNYTTCLEQNNPSELIAPTLIHLCWGAASTYSRHDFLGGVRGANMRFSPEKDFKANKGMERAREFLEPIKARHPLMSYADLWTLAAVVAIESLGGPVIEWVSGRPDTATDDAKSAGDVSTSRVAVTEDRCPVADSGSLEGDIDHLKVLFGRIGGLKYKHIVALFGAHSVGRCHENASGYSGTWTRDECTFSNEYFRLLLEEKWALKASTSHSDSKNKNTTSTPTNRPREFRNEDGSLLMLPVDMALLHDPEFRSSVERYAADEKEFFADFAFAFQKLINNGVEENTVQRSYISRILGF